MVGDDLNNDVLAAQVVGMTGVLVRPGNSARTPWTDGPQTNSRWQVYPCLDSWSCSPACCST